MKRMFPDATIELRKWEIYCGERDWMVAQIRSPNGSMHLLLRFDLQKCGTSPVPLPDMVQNNVNRSRQWFKGMVEEKSLFPPASVPELSVKDGILKGIEIQASCGWKWIIWQFVPRSQRMQYIFACLLSLGCSKPQIVWIQIFRWTRFEFLKGIEWNLQFEMFLDAKASAAHSRNQSGLGRKHFTNETDWSHAAYIVRIWCESGLNVRLIEAGSRSRNQVLRSDK